MANQLDTGNYSLSALSPAAVDSKDNNQPYTDSYSFTIAQRTPWSGLLEVSYVGNSTSDIPNAGNGGSIGANSDNINKVPIGAMLSSKNGGADPNLLIADNFRPLLGFSDLNLTTNNLYSNYNSLQVTWARTKGRYTLSLNYTYGKALGILSAYDQFNMANNYGVLAANRTQIFNAAYSVELGNPVHGKVAGGFVNGWQLSGITQLQSGANLAANSGENFGFNLNGYKIPGHHVQRQQRLDPGHARYPAPADFDMQSDVKSRAAPVHQPELLRHSDDPRRRTVPRPCRRSTDRPSSIPIWRCSRISRSRNPRSCNSASTATTS